MSLVMGVCARVDVLDNGRVIARGDPVSVRANPDVQEAYLGGTPVRHRRRPAACRGPATAVPGQGQRSGGAAIG